MTHDANEQFHLGRRYTDGDGVPKDTMEAAKWYSMAVGKMPEAQTHLSIMYYLGRKGVQKDLVEAHTLCNIASARGETLAKAILRDIEKCMSAAQIAEATKLANERFEKYAKKN